LLLGSVADSTDISIDAAAARHAERVNFGPTVSRSNAVVHNCIDLRKRWGRQKEDGRTDGRTDRPLHCAFCCGQGQRNKRLFTPRKDRMYTLGEVVR